MPKYMVYGLMTATKVIGEYEADSKEEAIKKADNDPGADWWVSLCHQCSREIDLGDIYETQAEEIKNENT